MKRTTPNTSTLISRYLGRKACGLIAGVFLCFISQAQVIANWTFNGLLGGVPGLNNLVGAAAFSPGVPTRAFNGGTEYFGENGWPSGGINTGMYLEFSVSPLPLFQLDISSIVLRIRRSNTGSPSGSGPTSWSLRSSVDGFATDIASGSITHNYANYTITPGSAFLQLYSTVTFRLYGYNASSNPGGSSRLVVDNISISGISSVLPASFSSFIATPYENKVGLQFSLLNTERDSHYFIERSADGNHFSVIHEMSETERANVKSHTWQDDQLPEHISQLFYRVHVRNASGSETLSAVVPVSVHRNRPTSIRAAIRNNTLYLSTGFTSNGSAAVCLYTNAGLCILRKEIKTVNGYQSLAIPIPSIAAGVYIVQVSAGTMQSSIIVNGQ